MPVPSVSSNTLGSFYRGRVVAAMPWGGRWIPSPLVKGDLLVMLSRGGKMGE